MFGATAGMLHYRADRAPNLVAEATGVCPEIGLAALVVDRLVSRHQQRRWNFAYDALAQRVSETFVDVRPTG
ncbi:hypothetical protein AB0M43_07510 [Longispora sp. NPDC051575]|uniref:hypothetical protein n=1 Tax=Longispora sp. NPDC051575 TaxID=3154943 RepID=UPI003446CF59